MQKLNNIIQQSINLNLHDDSAVLFTNEMLGSGYGIACESFERLLIYNLQQQNLPFRL